jgi:dTDP-4-amino-4,6-dideoxygalactose transaminase
MLIVQTEEELKKIQEMRLIGMGQPAGVMYKNQRAWTYDVKGIGFRYHMANLHAAIGLAQLGKMDKISEKRGHACRYYSEKLGTIKEIAIPKTDFYEIVPFLYAIRVPEDKRDALRVYLRDRGVDTGIHWQPGHWFTLFKRCRKGDLTFTDKVGREILSLPSHPCLSQEELDVVCDSIASFFRNSYV